MTADKIKAFLLCCTLTKEEYDLIRPLVWRRNGRILKITSLLAAGMGGLFFVINRLTHAAVWTPYLLLLCGSAAVYLLHTLIPRKKAPGWWDMLLCYGEMLFMCLYAGILSTQPSNYAIPATSVIVFIAILPLTIDDRPIRMFSFMLAESVGYLIVSRLYKSPGAFSLDVLNVATFCVVGMILYSVICVRNIREIHQGVLVDRIQQSVITSLATVVEERDENTGGHITRTGSYVEALIGQMKGQADYASLSEDFYRNVILAAPMHDVGKIKVPDAILNKPGRLTDEEYSVMKKHAAYGEEIIRKTMQDVEEEGYFTVACNIARHHHERYDGKGYPDGLAGEKIPLEARIMALADVYDALVSPRVYKEPFSRAKARQIIQEGVGTQFDPRLAALFLDCV